MGILGPQDVGKGHGGEGVSSVLVELLRDVACLFLGRFSNFFCKLLHILQRTFVIFIKFFLDDFLTFKIQC